ncbi:MAG: DnaJ domain-containing protein [Flavobacteriia bacterium]|nr:DnaJ domain-containing protein [Flavobacteriia bacterium]PIV97732.1 MAG: hypothetical protein COW43_01565 [Flavobacteriaceae bacterium CG17_big_fil_post_rev_8_21_14_2_50_31_13]PIX11130.1 MAG: hypothetical protein COZ74_14840 [Flavobacteriaceae bacterium CG_4_8_14_3_um_filter_31_8]PIY14155.1 MAG: hypothetical protein COZ16_10610 [Flavobacteriaceae bacterium CG_4_10_14_3_um_filter_31_253]PIZ10413.1 MAG: hypothetical protein COY55_08335 [Flavobacteriaceae bacterium CG_4_10_14_0_8_um_filter_31_9
MNNYYYKLGLKSNASLNEIKISYRKLSKALHPDKNNSEKFYEEILKEINEAYEILSNVESRKKYDSEYSRFNSSYGNENEFIKNQLNKITIEKNNLFNENKILKSKISDLINNKQNDNEAYFLKNELNKYFEEKKDLQRKITELEKLKKGTNYSQIFYTIILLVLGFLYFYNITETKTSKTTISNYDERNFQDKIKKLEFENQKLQIENNNFSEKLINLNNEKLEIKKTELKTKNNENEEENTKNYSIFKGEFLYKSKTFTYAPIYTDENLKNKIYSVDLEDYVYVIKKQKQGIYKVWYLGSFGYISEGMLKNK